MKHKSLENRWTGLLFIAPWLFGFLAFQAYPIAMSLVYSFTNYSMGDSTAFIGLDNYTKMFFQDPEFWSSLGITVTYVLILLPLKLVFALVVALVLNTKVRGINAFRTVYYLPSILGGSVAVSLLWRYLFMGDGLVNQGLAVLGLPPVGWLSQPGIALVTVSLLSVWQFGSSMVIFLAGLKQIPAELYEAARIDGASRWRAFTAVTIPLLSPIVLFNLVMQLVSAFTEFTGVFVITAGGPMKSTYLYVMKLYNDGFQSLDMGYASALSWVLFALIVLVTTLIFRSSGTWVHYSDGGKS